MIRLCEGFYLSGRNGRGDGWEGGQRSFEALCVEGVSGVVGVDSKLVGEHDVAGIGLFGHHVPRHGVPVPSGEDGPVGSVHTGHIRQRAVMEVDGHGEPFEDRRRDHS